MNKTDPAIMKCTELANAVLAQTKEDETNQRQALEIAVLQTQKIQALEARLEQQLANIATNNSIPQRIPPSFEQCDEMTISVDASHFVIDCRCLFMEVLSVGCDVS